MTNVAVSFPRTTLNIIASDNKVGFEQNRAIIFGQKTTAGSAAVGLNVNVPQTAAEIDALFGPTSHLAMVCKKFRKINAYTNLDAMAFADAASSTAATAVVTFTGTATAAGTFTVIIASKEIGTFSVDVEVGDTATVIGAKLVSAIGLGGNLPFTAANSSGAVTATAASKGSLANGWPLIISGRAAGITVALTGWTGGATDPSLTAAFDPIENLRYQHVLWPSSWVKTGLVAFMDGRKNVDNDILDGRAFYWSTAADITTMLTEALALNSSEVVPMWNKPNALATWKGPYLPEAPDLLAVNFMAARARRMEPNVSITDIVANNESLDQFGGPALNSLPYFNTPLLGVGQPYPGTGCSQAEQLDLENGGVTFAGANRSGTAVVMGSVVTAYQFDPAGNPDNTWKYLEWRDTHGAVREYLVLNCRKRFAQYRLTGGEAIANRAIVTEDMIAGYILALCTDLMGLALIQSGQAARQFIQDNLVVTADLENRQVFVTLVFPMVSQLGAILGTVKYTFDFGATSAAAA